MFGPDWDEGCSGCSMMADHIGPLSHLHAKDTSFLLVSRAPLAKLLEFRDRMGWTLPWVSSGSTTFNEDFRATVDGEEHHAISVFLRDGDRVFHTCLRLAEVWVINSGRPLDARNIPANCHPPNRCLVRSDDHPSVRTS